MICFDDRRGLLDAVVAVVDARLRVDGEMRGAAGIGIVVLISADYVGRIVLVAAVIGRHGPALSQFDAGRTLRVGIEAAVGAAAAHHLEAAMPGIGQIERKADAIGEMIGILRAVALVDDADDVAIA